MTKLKKTDQSANRETFLSLSYIKNKRNNSLPSKKPPCKCHLPALLFPLLGGRQTGAAPRFSVNGLGSKAIRQKIMNHSPKHNSRQKRSFKQVKLSYLPVVSNGFVIHSPGQVLCLVRSLRMRWYLAT